MAAFLAPAIGVMNRLSVQGKMFLLGLIGMIPIIVLAFMLLDRIEGDLAFTRKETVTVPVVGPARQLMQAVQAHRGVSQTVIAGNSSLSGRIDELRGRAETAIKAGNEVDSRLGHELGTDKA